MGDLTAMGRSSSGEGGAGEKYRDHTREQLVARIRALEGASFGNEGNEQMPEKGKGKQKAARPFDINRYPCRKIALRFAYDGEAYSGLEMQPIGGSMDGTSIETVESVLWRALCDARLVDDAQGGLAGVGWSRCGRTDRGVSAAGQVVAFWIRSRKVDEWAQRRAFDRLRSEEPREGVGENEADKQEDVPQNPRRVWHERTLQRIQRDVDRQQEHENDHREARIYADPNAEELPYVTSLNRLLPPTVQVQAWSPVKPTFNARFDCQYRHYKYFFTAGAPFVRSANIHGPLPPLDIAAMRKAAQRFLGEHDFRNFCKVDPSKQMEVFYRRIDGISIDLVSSSWDQKEQKADTSKPDDVSSPSKEQMYVLNLRGTAFLYHQVRHIVAVLFLVGAGLEKASVIDELLNVESDGVFQDRLLMARLNGLLLHDNDDDVVQTKLPPTSAHLFEKSGIHAPDLIENYQTLRKQAMHDGELSQDEREALAPLRGLFVYDRKPMYDMALDRPLMLWECGFHAEDVAWRAGTYDGPLNAEAITRSSASVEQINGPTDVSRALMHALWTSQAITAEIFRHFTLALPSNDDDDVSSSGGIGYLPSSTSFGQASFPTLQSNVLPTPPDVRRPTMEKDRRNLIPLGNGCFKTMPTYTPLRNVARQSTPAEKNGKWMLTKGQKRAAILASRQQQQQQRQQE